jgi:hypothetical protein
LKGAGLYSDGTLPRLLTSLGSTPQYEGATAGTLLGKAWDFVTIEKIRGFSRTCWNYCSAYHRKLDIVTANYYMRKFRRHRCYNKTIDLSLDNYMALDAEYLKQQELSAKENNVPVALEEEDDRVVQADGDVYADEEENQRYEE